MSIFLEFFRENIPSSFAEVQANVSVPLPREPVEMPTGDTKIQPSRFSDPEALCDSINGHRLPYPSSPLCPGGPCPQPGQKPDKQSGGKRGTSPFPAPSPLPPTPEAAPTHPAGGRAGDLMEHQVLFTIRTEHCSCLIKFAFISYSIGGIFY